MKNYACSNKRGRSAARHEIKNHSCSNEEYLLNVLADVVLAHCAVIAEGTEEGLDR